MSLEKTKAEKSAAKAKRTKAANLKIKQEEMIELARQKTKTAKLRSELKAYKDLIRQGWSPPGGK